MPLGTSTAGPSRIRHRPAPRRKPGSTCPLPETLKGGSRLSPGRQSSSGRWGDREAADRAVALDEAREQTVFLRLLDKVAQEGKAGGVLFLRADRLLHGRALAREVAMAGRLWYSAL